MKTKGLWASAALLCGFVLICSTADAKRLRAEGAIPLFGINSDGNVDLGLVGSGIGKISLSTRTGRVRASARGTAPNLSGRKFRFRTRDIDVAGAALESVLGVALPPAPDGVSLSKVRYLVKRKGTVRALARLRLSDDLVDAVVDTM